MNAEDYRELCRDLAGMDWRAGQPKRLSLLVALEHCGEMEFFGVGARYGHEFREPVHVLAAPPPPEKVSVIWEWAREYYKAQTDDRRS
ncbi:MAG: hypothetical protein ACR2HO_04885 [Rubrobacteraceae bacterium]